MSAGVFTGGVIGVAVTGYAYLTPATYRASSTIGLDPAPGAAANALAPREASQRLREALLARDVLEHLTANRVGSSPSQPSSSVARSVRDAVEVDSTNGRRFELSVRDSQPQRAADLANLLARRAVEAAPQILAADREAELRQLRNERQRANDALVLFLSRHPELVGKRAGERVGAPPTELPPPDPKLDELRAERARILLRLAPRVDEGGKHNPYSDPSALDPETPVLERRLGELNAALSRPSKRSQGAKSLPPTPDPEAPLAAELAALLRSAADSKARQEASERAAPTLTARIVARASAPSAPIDPDRPLILLWGAFSALIAGALVAAWQRAGLSLLPAPPAAAHAEAAPETSEKPARSVSAAPARAVAVPSARPDATASNRPIQGKQPVFEIEMAETQQAVLDSILFPSAGQPPTSSADPPHVRDDNPPSSAQRPRYANPPSSASREIIQTAFERDRLAHGARPLTAALPRAAVEVNAALSPPASPRASSAPPGELSAPSPSMRTTQVLGSPILPATAPKAGTPPFGEARGETPPPTSSTSYRYVSTPPPESLGRNGTQQIPRASTFPAGSPRVQCERVEAGWRPDMSLIPESRRGLCEELYASAIEGCTVVLVAGPSDAGDEKSRVAAELSLALAESGHTRVLLVEGNLRRPQAHRFLRLAMPRGLGLSQQLRARAAEARPPPWTVIECFPSLHALCESETPLPELIVNRALEACMKELRRAYDLIVIDGPLTSDLPACHAMDEIVDSAILVHLRSKTPGTAEANALFPGKRVALIAAAG